MTLEQPGDTAAMPGDSVTTVVVSGYASLDHAVATARGRRPGGTGRVRSRLSDPWPSPGGAAHVAAQLVLAGVRTEVLSWVGPDPDGETWINSLRRLGAGTKGVQRSGTRSPQTWLVHPDDGDALCLFDPADCHPSLLTPGQRCLLARAACACLTVQPADLTESTLDCLPPRVPVVWLVEPDPDAYPPPLAARLAQRASVFTLSCGARGFVETSVGRTLTEVSEGRLVVETSGAAGLRYWLDGRGGDVGVDAVAGRDTAGAGDALTAALTAHLLDRGLPAVLGDRAEVARALYAAVDAVAHTLRTRPAPAEGHPQPNLAAEGVLQPERRDGDGGDHGG